jgi:hypothetical protein
MHIINRIPVLLTAQVTLAYNSPYESTQLAESDIGNYSDVVFGKIPGDDPPQCKNYPGYYGWPTTAQWSALDVSLGGTLLKDISPVVACYEGVYKDTAKCANVRRRQSDALFAYV